MPAPGAVRTFAATCAQAGDYFTMLTEKRAEILSMSGWAPKDPNAAAIERSVSRRWTTTNVTLIGYRANSLAPRAAAALACQNLRAQNRVDSTVARSRSGVSI
ncbi:MAG: hypothetical protein ACRDR6_07175 [Pseudonocardiaceae bacterium]